MKRRAKQRRQRVDLCDLAKVLNSKEQERNGSMKNYLATINDVTSLADNLRAARQEVGSGAGCGDTFLKVDDRTGEITFGQENAPLPAGHRFVVGLHEINHGYVVSTPPPAKVLERRLVPMAQGGARPTPPSGQYGTYEQGGARDVVEIGLSSVDEPGFQVDVHGVGIEQREPHRQLAGPGDHPPGRGRRAGRVRAPGGDRQIRQLPQQEVEQAGSPHRLRRR